MPADTNDAGFWQAVESGDLTGLADTLNLDADALGAVVPALSSWHRNRRDTSTVDGWRYAVAWRPSTPSAATLAGTWALAGADPDAGRRSPGRRCRGDRAVRH